jgi:hypothetical protein
MIRAPFVLTPDVTRQRRGFHHNIDNDQTAVIWDVATAKFRTRNRNLLKLIENAPRL